MVTTLFRGLVDIQPYHTGLVPPNVLWMVTRQLLITGTACPRPALLIEAADTAANVRLDMMIVRDEFDAPFGYRTSFDVRLEEEKRWRCSYYLWQAEDDRLWLLPDGDRPGGLRVATIGFVVTEKLPYSDEAERKAGFDRANHKLETAARGL